LLAVFTYVCLRDIFQQRYRKKFSKENYCIHLPITDQKLRHKKIIDFSSERRWKVAIKLNALLHSAECQIVAKETVTLASFKIKLRIRLKTWKFSPRIKFREAILPRFLNFLRKKCSKSFSAT
jgi:hypothetical protein